MPATPFTPTDGEYIDATVVVPDTAYSYARALWVGGAGAVQLVTPSGANVVFSGVPAGTLLRVASSLVVAAGTTATLMLALR